MSADVRRLAYDATQMNNSLSSVRWLRILIAAVAVIAVSFLILMIIVTGYAFVLAFQVRGAPNQNAINHFAARISSELMPWLEMFLTLVVSFILARRVGTSSILYGLFIGILAGLLSFIVTLAFGGRLGLHSLVFLLTVVGLGLLGGYVGQKKAVRP